MMGVDRSRESGRPAARRGAAAVAGALGLAAAVAAIGLGTARAADRTEPLPAALEGVGIDEHLGAAVPLGTELRDEEGRPVTLGSFFGHGRPVILTLNYSNCPMLCSLQLDGLVEGLLGLDWVAGREFEIVTVSIDPKEAPERAKRTKEKYLRSCGRATAAEGWHFLTGGDPAIHAVAEAVGFKYRYLLEQNQYAHTAALILCTPDGKVARYLYGVQYDPQTLRLALLESSRGSIGTTTDRILLYCFHYDATEGRYTLAAANVMKAGGAATVIVLLVLLLTLRPRRSAHRGAEPSGAPC